MTTFSYSTLQVQKRLPSLGLIVLQADETIENEFKIHFPTAEASLLTSRVPSGLEVTTDSLSEMSDTLETAASLFPRSSRFDVVGYACTSGTATIGQEKVASLVHAGCQTAMVTNPVSAVLEKCRANQISKIALLSPYVEEVSQSLREVLEDGGITTPVFGSFNEAEEAKVAQIDEESIIHAALELGWSNDVEGVFISCTNLKTLGFLDEIERELNKPVFSSNSSLAEHMAILAAR